MRNGHSRHVRYSPNERLRSPGQHDTGPLVLPGFPVPGMTCRVCGGGQALGCEEEGNEYLCVVLFDAACCSARAPISQSASASTSAHPMTTCGPRSHKCMLTARRATTTGSMSAACQCVERGSVPWARSCWAAARNSPPVPAKGSQMLCPLLRVSQDPGGQDAGNGRGGVDLPVGLFGLGV